MTISPGKDEQQKMVFKFITKSETFFALDIIAVMITYGGSNAMICHGAGITFIEFQLYTYIE
jgi:hypothetical protein